MAGKLPEDQWQARATAAAIAAARKLATEDGVINKNAPIGRLGDIEWGWIVAAILFAWISTRAEQAATEELDTEQCIRMTGLDRNPWDSGAIGSILSELADAQVDWPKPLCEGPRETMIDFLLEALRHMSKGMICLQLGGGFAPTWKSAVECRQSTAP